VGECKPLPCGARADSRDDDPAAGVSVESPDETPDAARPAVSASGGDGATGKGARLWSNVNVTQGTFRHEPGSLPGAIALVAGA